MRDPLLPPPNSVFWILGEAGGGQFPTESEFSEEKTFHFRISGVKIYFNIYAIKSGARFI